MQTKMHPSRANLKILYAVKKVIKFSRNVEKTSKTSLSGAIAWNFLLVHIAYGLEGLPPPSSPRSSSLLGWLLKIGFGQLVGSLRRAGQTVPFAPFVNGARIHDTPLHQVLLYHSLIRPRKWVATSLEQ